MSTNQTPSTGGPADISDPRVGQQVLCPFVVTEVVEKEAKNKKKFRNIELTNETGRIRTRVWQEKFDLWKDVEPGSPVMVTGRIEEGFPEGTVELAVQKLEALDTPHPVQKHMNPIYPGDVEALEAEFYRMRERIDHPGYRLFFDRFFETACPKDKFFSAPAARGNHHAYIHGLLEHSLEVTKTALHFADMPEVSDVVNKDLVLVGSMIHDSGKIHEYVWDGVPIDMNPDSLLMGHISTGVLMIREVMARHGEELKEAGFTRHDVKHLMHMVISHHGKMEWGSPTPPHTVSAQLLHQADMMSSRVRGIAQLARDNTPDRNGKVDGPGYGAYRHGIMVDPDRWEVETPAVDLAAELADEEPEMVAPTETDDVIRSMPGIFDQTEETQAKAETDAPKRSGRSR